VTTAAQVASVEPAAPVAARATESPAVAPRAAAARKVAAPKAPKVAAETRNGIARPRAGGACDAIWKLLDLRYNATGVVPTSKDARKLATENGLNVGNSLCELSRGRRFVGLARARA
jgi:pyruvate/2-oxoglutarate dehydrogenase complex dihydrolipoamide acyltransferase (E2) component